MVHTEHVLRWQQFHVAPRLLVLACEEEQEQEEEEEEGEEEER